MTGITSVAFGPDGSWVVCEDSNTTWSCGLPDSIYNHMNGRSSNRRCAPTNVAAMGPGGTYALFYSDHNWCVTHDGLADHLNENGTNGCDVKTMSFGDDGSYLFVLKEGGCYYYNVPYRLDQLIQTKNNASIQWATIGRGGALVIIFEDKYYWSDDIPSGLKRVLNSNGGSNIVKVWLSPFDKGSYFLERADGSTEWNASESLSNNQLCDKWKNPKNILYTNDSIRQEFSCGRSIHDVAEELRYGTIDADDIPLMEVFDWNGNTYSLNNRRLWALSTAGVDSTPIKYVNPPGHVVSKLRNGFDGTSVWLR